MKMNDYQEGARSTAIFPPEQALAYLALGLNGEAGEVADKLKKIIRDSRGVDALSEEEKTSILRELGDVLWYVALMSATLDATLESVAEMNLKKLRDRQTNGTLKGSGDLR